VTAKEALQMRLGRLLVIISFIGVTVLSIAPDRLLQRIDADDWAARKITLDDVYRRMARDLLTVVSEAQARQPHGIEEFLSKIADIEKLAKQHGHARVVVRYKDQAPAIGEPGVATRANYWFWKQVGWPTTAPPQALGQSRFVRQDVSESEVKKLVADPKIDLVIPDIPIPPALGKSGPVVRPGLVQILAAATRPNRQPFAAVVLDSGVEADHPFLEGAILTALEACFSSEHLSEPYKAESVCPNSANSMKGPGAAKPCAQTGCDHGTHVAGIIAGWHAKVAGEKIIGVAPTVPVIPIQIYSKFNSETFCGMLARKAPCIAAFISDQLAALDYVKELNDRGIAVGSVNMSLAMRTEKGKCDAFDFVTGIAERVRELKRLGIPTVIAAGNDGSLDKVSVPGCIEDAVTVAASDNSGQLAIRFPDDAGGTNFSDLVDLAAPGVSIKSSVPGKGFAVKSGTSMAAPHVAGLLAVIRNLQPTATVDEQVQLLAARATRFVEHPSTGMKRPVAFFVEVGVPGGVALPAEGARGATRGDASVSSASSTRLILDFGDEDPAVAETRVRELLRERGIPVLEIQSKTSRLGVVVTDKPVHPSVIEEVRQGARLKGLYVDVPQAPPK
jgi:hypothetical protein